METKDFNVKVVCVAPRIKIKDNFLDWLTQDYKKRLRTNIRSNFDEIKNKK